MDKKLLKLTGMCLIVVLVVSALFIATKMISGGNIIFGGTLSEYLKNENESRDIPETTEPSEQLIGQSATDESQETVPEETVPQTPDVTETTSTITIAAVGDIMCHADNLRSAYDSKKNTYDFKGVFKYVEPYIKGADLAVANFETVTAGEKAGYSSYPLFNTPDAILEALSYAGFDVLVTANNHCLDMGKQGLVRTIEMIRENNMINTGTRTSPEDKNFAMVEIGDFRIAVLAYTYGCNGNIVRLSEAERKYMVNLIDEEKIENDIKTARRENADIVIVCMHWGIEYEREADRGQMQLAEKIFDWGADVIFGSHPHVIQKSEFKNVSGSDRYVIYSLGNFVSNFRREDTSKRKNRIYTEDGVIVMVEFEKPKGPAKGGAKIKNVVHIPTWMDKYTENGKIVFEIIPIPESEPSGPYVNARNIDKIRTSYANTMELMAK